MVSVNYVVHFSLENYIQGESLDQYVIVTEPDWSTKNWSNV